MDYSIYRLYNRVQPVRTFNPPRETCIGAFGTASKKHHSMGHASASATAQNTEDDGEFSMVLHSSPESDSASDEHSTKISSREDGSFFIHDNFDWGKSDNRVRNEDSSMRAEMCSIPDIESLCDQDQEESSTGEAFPSVLEVELTADLLQGMGDWQTVRVSDTQQRAPIFSWRHEVTIADFEKDTDGLGSIHLDDEQITPLTVSKDDPPSPPLIVRLARRQRANPTASIAGSAPGLTEGSSRDTESVNLSEDPIRRGEETVNTESALYRETEVSATPLLDEEVALMSRYHQFCQIKAPEQHDLPKDIPNFADEGWDSRVKNLPDVSQNSNQDDECESIAETLQLTEDENDSSETGSYWMSDYSEALPTLSDRHPFLLVRKEVVLRALCEFQAWRNHTNNSSEPAQSGSISKSANGDNSSDWYPNKKPARRKDSDHDENEDGSGEEDDEPPKKRSRTKKGSMGREVSLACPYAKKDFATYRTCYAYTMKRIKDVKQHLSRYHQLPIFCRRCKQCFNSENELDAHATAVTVCQVKEKPIHEGLTKKHKEQLAKRVSAKMALKDQWFAIFEILFPDNPKPLSPFVDPNLSAELEAFQDFLGTRGASIILRTLTARGISSNTPNEEHDLSTFLLQSIQDGILELTREWAARFVTEQTSTEGDMGESSAFSFSSYTAFGSQHSQTSSNTLVDRQENIRSHSLTQLDPVHEEQYIDSLISASGNASIEKQTVNPRDIALSPRQDTLDGVMEFIGDIRWNGSHT